MPATPCAARKQQITLAQLSSYDDILTDALVDHAYYWTTIPKNRISYHPSRGVTESKIAKIIQSHLIVEPDIELAETKLLATEGLRRFHNGLKTPKEKDDFRAHLRRYMRLYLPDCPFEVSSTNRYTIMSHEAAITARKFIKRGQPVKYLEGIQVMITEKEDRELSKRKKDFSIVVSARNKCASLFMGPARFANHDCGANARLTITGHTGIEIVATQNIEVGDEITVSYADNYFGEDNCECLCSTCEENAVNGWAQPEGGAVLNKSVEEVVAEGYFLRRRSNREDSCASASRTPSVTPDIRPRIRKTRPKAPRVDSEGAPITNSPVPQNLLRQKRKREIESLQSPPVTPAKKLKMAQYEVQPIPMSGTLSRRSSDDISASGQSSSESGSADMAMTDATTPEEDPKEPGLSSPALTPTRLLLQVLKQEESETSSLSELAFTPSEVACDENPVAEAPLPTIETTQAAEQISAVLPINPAVVELSSVEPITLPSPIAPVPSEDVAVLPPSALSTAESAVKEEPERGRPRRGRPRKGEERKVVAIAEVTPTQIRKRTPGDYQLTPALLFEPNTAWIHCTICNDPFVQQNAYYTRSSCPRCERHSKLYGYQWPKTEKEGPNDKEERILDHRLVHRFLTADDEAKIRGRRPPSSYLKPATALVVVEGEAPVKRGRGRPRKYPLPQLVLPAAPAQLDPDAVAEDEDEDEGDSGSTRRSGRRRQPSLKAAGC
ncbi:Uu.00g000070.m01.CDS01 [Anthostomella pinea]|uniref:Histone-lysine N-methyltransferase SET9 n=1 Tax=Anthostomella pinea TaxID=933095 RepID=A0AAI8VJ72_9PEZI|nr:Uu.00g000070.m01.CDS01 [Anthostomella pinea]